MRLLVFLLVLANLLAYVIGAGYFGRPDHPDAARLTQQVAPERVRIVSRGEAPATRPAPPPAEPEAVAPTCLRWRGLDAAEASTLSRLLGERHPGFALDKATRPDEGKGWWVFIPAAVNRAEAEKKAAELRQLGVTDYFILPDNNPNRLAISLGIFSTEKGAQERLTELRGKGVRSARLMPRPGQAPRFDVEARGPLPERDALLATISEALPRLNAEDCP